MVPHPSVDGVCMQYSLPTTSARREVGTGKGEQGGNQQVRQKQTQTTPPLVLWLVCCLFPFAVLLGPSSDAVRCVGRFSLDGASQHQAFLMRLHVSAGHAALIMPL